MMKERRENPQEPAQVRPTPTLRPSTTGTATTGIAEEPDTKARTDRTPAAAPASAAPLPAARPAIARVPPAAAPAATASVAPPPAAAPVAPAAEPTTLPPVVVNANPPNTSPPAAVQPETQPRSFAANVFSSISVFAGTAANATGNTVNWVIELPGRAISAGGKLIGGDSAGNNPPPAPAAAPAAPAGAPPSPKRNYL
jgi:hypothetical protein